MATLNVSIPDNLRSYVEERVAQDGYGNLSEYVRDLIRDDQKRKAQERLEALLLEGLDSGPAAPLTNDDMNAVRRVVRERIARRKEGRKQ